MGGQENTWSILNTCSGLMLSLPSAYGSVSDTGHSGQPVVELNTALFVIDLLSLA